MTFDFCEGVNDAGRILGYGRAALGTYTDRSFLLTPAVAGDANRDGKVDINDLTIVLSHFGQKRNDLGQGEFTGNGTVDINDLTIVLSHFGQSPGSSAGGLAAVPEPGSLTLSALAVAGLLAYIRRKRG